MPSHDALNFLSAAGVTYRSAETPILWSHLESNFTEPHRVGPKFNSMPTHIIAALIAEGENMLVEELAASLRRTGRIGSVRYVLNLPYPVGTCAVKERASVNPTEILNLIQSPGTNHEKIVQVVLAPDEEIPETNQMTVEGGLYADGHTAGYYDILPGDLTAHDYRTSDVIYMATREDIRRLAYDMCEKIDEISIASPRQCVEMVERVVKVLR